MVKRVTWILLLMLAASARVLAAPGDTPAETPTGTTPPAEATTPEAPTQPERLVLEQDRKVTLEMKGVTAQEAVAKLSEAAGVPLECVRRLSERKVTLIARERPATEVGEALARAVEGKWRRTDQGFTLEAIGEPLEALTPSEVAVELRRALLQMMGMPPDQVSYYAARELLEQLLPTLPPDGLQALHARQPGRGLPVAVLTPQQRQRIGWLVVGRIADALNQLLRQFGTVQRSHLTTLSIRKQDEREMLELQTDAYNRMGIGLPGATNP